MKKLVSLLLAIILVFTIVNVMAVAENAPQIVIDGVKDEAYTDSRMLDYTNWMFWDNVGQNNFDPVDYERVLNTVWFNWDDTHVYIYFQCVSKDDLYKRAPEETKIADHDTGPFYEIAQIYLDTAPGLDWDAPCIWAGQDGNLDTCAHIACNCRGGSGSAYRLMARANPAWGAWNDYYASASGMFMDYESFAENYAGREGYEDMAAAYALAHGNGDGQAVTFIDYETNTYGFEMKFPRHEGEDHFQFNIRTRVNETEWDEYGPELPYSVSFCKAWWLNSDELFEVYYSDYENETPAEVSAFRRMKEQLPLDVSMIDASHRIAVIELNAAFEKLNDEQKTYLTAEEIDFVTKAFEKINKIDYLAKLGDVNEDGGVNATDALIALRASVGKVTLDDATISRAEVNGDGKVDAKDALEMLQYTVGKRKEFTIAKTIDL